MEKVEYINTYEQPKINKGLLILVNLYPPILDKTAPVKKCEFNYLGKENTCLSLFPKSNAIKTKTYLNDSYDAVFQFDLIYRDKSSTTIERLNAQTFLDELGAWLSSLKDIEIFDETITNVSIIMPNTSVLIYRDNNGNEDYKCSFTMKYHKKS